MRFASVRGRATVVVGEVGVDVEKASEGRFPSDPMAAYRDWSTFLEWASSVPSDDGFPIDPTELECPSPRPSQVFAVGLNYVDHSEETGLTSPSPPSIFTKFPSCLTGPHGDLVLPPGSVDWEVELVVVIGRTARRVPASSAWDHVAGLAVGQDISERQLQWESEPPQFSLGKSFPGFGPVGPHVVSLDEVPNRDALELTCTLNGEVMQRGVTSDMICPVPTIIERLSAVCTLEPGDLIFTGTPAGVGMGRTPERYLSPGDVLISAIEGIGEMRHVCVAAAD